MMTSKNWLSGFGRTLGAVVLSTGLTAVGCGDDDSGTTPDAGGNTPDSGMMGPDAGCQMPGHGGGDCGPLNPFNAPNGEGGEVRIELFQQADGASRLAVQAFFFKGQEPLLRPMTGPANLDPDTEMPTGCYEYKAGDAYNNGANPRHQEIAETREYLDVGETITLTNRDDAEDVMVLSKSTDPDPSNRIQHGVLYVGDETFVPTPASLYSWELDGTSADYLAFNLLNGASAATMGPVPDGYQPDVYFPQQFTMTSPTEEDYFGGPVTFTKGEALTLSWENAGDENEVNPGTVAFVGFVTENNEVESWCLGPDTGEFTVPPTILEYVSSEGQLMVGKFAHTAWLQAQNDDNTRIDVLGVNCKLSSYEIQEVTTTAK